MFKLCPTSSPVNGACFIHILGHRLQAGYVNDGIHGNGLPRAYNHNRKPGPFRTGKDAVPLAANHLDDGWKNIGEEIVENIAYNQGAQNIRNEVHPAQGAFEFDFAVQT